MSQRSDDLFSSSLTADELAVEAGTHRTAAMQQFQQLRQQMQMAMRALANIAEQQGISYEEATEGFGGEQLSRRPLAKVLLHRAKRLDEPFRLAVIGEFSRGKSSLINAMLNAEILTSDHRPNTAAQTILKGGFPERFKVTFLPVSGRPPEEYLSNNLQADLARFTSDASIDGERGEEVQASYISLMKGERQSLAEQITKVEVWLNSEFLHRTGIEIIDTPGLGAVFKTHEQVTLKIMHTVDAILFTVQIDPGVDGREVAFLRLIREHVPKIFLVVTKVDHVARQEIAERVDHVRKTIEIKANMEAEHIFPVSAHLALEGAREESGFLEFLPTLEQFLVRSNGVARLVGPLRFTRTQARHTLKLLSEYLQRLGHSQAELEEELQALKTEAEQIRSVQEDLLDFVEESIKVIRLNALDGIKDLPTGIREKVEAEIKSLSSEDLRQANVFIQPAIKEAVAEWLEQRKENFTSGIQLLNLDVKKKLIELLKKIQFDVEQLSLIRSIAIEMDLPVDISKFTNDIGDRIMQTLLSMGISNTIISIAGSLARVASNAWGAIKRGFGRFFGGSSRSQTQDNRAEVQQRLCAALLEYLPGTTVNTYQAVVEGYQLNGHSVDGVSQVVRKTFTDWGDDLIDDISSLVNNNLNSRLHNLASQLEAQRSGLQENAREKANVAKMQVELDDVLKIVAKIEKQLAKLGVG